MNGGSTCDFEISSFNKGQTPGPELAGAFDLVALNTSSSLDTFRKLEKLLDPAPSSIVVFAEEGVSDRLVSSLHEHELRWHCLPITPSKLRLSLENAAKNH
ncbi:MAG: hypothetical protein F6K47_41840, partial [Symploca sp. SIO2E6]|nr:hypothetical protein [Symploca sp. SIO2E6]